MKKKIKVLILILKVTKGVFLLLKLTIESSHMKEDEDNEGEYSRSHHDNERKDTDKKENTRSLEKEKEFDDKQLHSNILFKSQDGFESGEGAVNEFGVDTLNVIEHIEMLNSVAGTLLSKNGKQKGCF